MHKLLTSVIRVLHGMTVLLSLMTGLAVLSTFFGGTVRENFLLTFILFLPFFASHFAALYCKHFVSFFLISLASVSFIFLAETSVALKILSIFVTVLMLVVRIIGRLRDEYDILTSPHFATVLLFIGFYLIGAFMENPLMTRVNYCLIFGYILMILIYMNLERMDGYLEINNSVTGVPVRQIRRINTGLLGTFLVLTAGVMLLVPFLGIERALSHGWTAFRAWYQGLVDRADTAVSSGTRAGTDDDPIETAEFNGLASIGDNYIPPWLEKFYDISTKVVLYIIILAIIIFIITAIYRMIRKFYRPSRETEDEEVFLSREDLSQKVGSKEEKKRPLWLDFSPEGLARRQYKRTVERKRELLREPVSFAAMTPEEIETAVSLSGESSEALHTLYEKARYSESGITRDELRILK